jgi:ABC-type Mn2+/Zn2+ transport system ATPase subunit
MSTRIKMDKSESSNIVECQNLTLVFGTHEILSNASCSIPRNSLTFLVGENGAGKTSLVRSILGLIPLTTGNIFIHSFEGRQPIMGYVPQRVEFPRQFQMTVSEYLNYSASVRKDSVESVLQKVDFPGSHMNSRITELSGGEVQKLLLAAELHRRPDILFLDEPLSNVDDSSEKHIIDVILEIKNSGVSIVIITHDWQTVSQYADHVICLNKNFLCETTESCICRNSLSKVEIRNIQKATPDPNTRHEGYCYIENV